MSDKPNKKRPVESNKTNGVDKQSDPELGILLKKRKIAEAELALIKVQCDLLVLNQKRDRLLAELNRDKAEPVKSKPAAKPKPKAPPAATSAAAAAASAPVPSESSQLTVPTSAISTPAAAVNLGLPPPLPALNTGSKPKPVEFRDIVLVIVMSDTKKHETSPSWLELCDLKGASGYGKEVMCSMQTKFEHPFNKALEYRIDSFIGGGADIRFSRSKEAGGLNVLAFTATTHGLSPQLVLEVLADFERAFLEVMNPRLESEFGKQQQPYFFTRIELSLTHVR